MRRPRYVPTTTMTSEASIRRTVPARSGGVVPAAVAGHLGQRGSGPVSLAEPVLQLVQRLDHAGSPEVVEHPERPASKRGEADAVDGADVAVARAPHDSFGTGGGGLVQHGVNQ